MCSNTYLFLLDRLVPCHFHVNKQRLTRDPGTQRQIARRNRHHVSPRSPTVSLTSKQFKSIVADIIQRRKSEDWELPEGVVAANALAREQGQRDRSPREREHNLGASESKTEVENVGDGGLDSFFARSGS